MLTCHTAKNDRSNPVVIAWVALPLGNGSEIPPIKICGSFSAPAHLHNQAFAFPKQQSRSEKPDKIQQQETQSRRRREILKGTGYRMKSQSTYICSGTSFALEPPLVTIQKAFPRKTPTTHPKIIIEKPAPAVPPHPETEADTGLQIRSLRHTACLLSDPIQIFGISTQASGSKSDERGIFSVSLNQ